MKIIFALTITTCLALSTVQLAQARGFGGSRGGESRGGYGGGESRGGSSGGESRGGYGGGKSQGEHSESESRGSPGGESHGGYGDESRGSPGGESRGGETGGPKTEGYNAEDKAKEPQTSGTHSAGAGAVASNRNAPQYSGAEGAAGGAAVANRNAPTASGAQGAAAGAAVSNRNSPQMSGAQGAAASNRNQPAYSGAQGATAGAAVANRNSPQMSGAQGAAAGAAVSNRNQPAYSGAQGAAAGAAIANNNAPQMSGPQGAVAGYAAAGGTVGGSYFGSVQGLQASGPVALPTDAGYGMTAAGMGVGGYAPNNSTQPMNASALATTGAAVRNSNPGAGAFNQLSAWAPGGWATGDEWHPATWPAVAAALGMDAGVQPAPFNYGTNITYQGNQVYSGGQPVATSDEYYQQAATVAQSAPPSNPQSSDWLPLGVFALVHQEQSTPKYTMQLAVNKSGAIAGNYCDLISETLQPVQGSVDKKTQRVAWTVGNNTTTVGEVGLYNLTQDEAPVLIHIGKDKTQQWLLVRLPQPKPAQPQN